MRVVLVNWLVDVHLRFDLKPDTLYLCVSLVDRFTQARHIDRAQY